MCGREGTADGWIAGRRGCGETVWPRRRRWSRRRRQRRRCRRPRLPARHPFQNDTRASGQTHTAVPVRCITHVVRADECKTGLLWWAQPCWSLGQCRGPSKVRVAADRSRAGRSPHEFPRPTGRSSSGQGGGEASSSHGTNKTRLRPSIFWDSEPDQSGGSLRQGHRAQLSPAGPLDTADSRSRICTGSGSCIMECCAARKD